MKPAKFAKSQRALNLKASLQQGDLAIQKSLYWVYSSIHNCSNIQVRRSKRSCRNSKPVFHMQ